MKKLGMTETDLFERTMDFVERYGYQSLTLRALAEHAGVSVGTLYNYFGDKDSLLDRIMTAYWQDIFGSDYQIIVKAGTDYISTLEKVYQHINRRSRHFHKVFSLRDVGSLHKEMAFIQAMRSTMALVQRKLDEILDQFPNEKAKVLAAIGDEAGYSRLVVENIELLMRQNSHDLGTFGALLRCLVK